jgi:hypothetical protein
MADGDLGRQGSGVRSARRTRALAPVVAAIVTVGLVSLAASAHDTDFNDPNDTPGRLDVSRVRLAHQPGPPRWSVIMFRGWTIREIWDRGYVMVLLDTRFSPATDFYLLVRSTGNALQGTLWEARSVGPDTFLGTVPVGKPSPRSVSVQVGLWKLTFGPSRRLYRWRVQTLFTSEACPRTCQDRAPNAGPVVQWRAGMSPTPSPSPSEAPAS